MSPIQTIIGSWHSATASTSQIIDLEAQTTVQGTHTPLPTSISTPLPTHSPRHSITGTDAVDDFFGVTAPSMGTRDSRHDLRLSAGELPPPYPESHHERRYSADLPAYDAAPVEPITLAMYLFKFGFLFPPFWLLGAIILLSPLSAPADFHANKPESERQELITIMRKAELKWARRCLFALAILLVTIGAIVGIVVGVMKGQVGL